MLKVVDAKVVQVKYRWKRRGSALLLVVVLVLLLAMMGTALLVTVRLSREQVTGTGSGAVTLPETEWWPYLAQSSWTKVGTGVTYMSTTSQTSVASSIMPTQTAGSPFRAPSLPDYVAIDPAQASLAFLAPRSPVFVGPREFAWSSLTQFAGMAPLSPYRTGVVPAGDGTLASPLGTSYPAPPLANLRVASFPIAYPDAFPGIPSLAGRRRVFPALYDPAGAGTYYLAGDADGDGIADSALYPLPAATVAPDIYTFRDGTLHPVTYWGAVRIIDNSGALNVNTAWRSDADRDFAVGGAIPDTDPLYGYLGAFRSNVGLYDLTRSLATPGIANPDVQDATRFDLFRMRSANASAQMFDEAQPTPRTIPLTGAGSYSFLTQGEAIEKQLIRRMANPDHATLAENPSYNGTAAAANQYQILPREKAWQDLVYHFGFVNPNVNDSEIGQHMPYLSRVFAPNGFTGTNSVQKSALYYGASQFDFWYYNAMDWSPARRGTFFNTPTPGAPYPNYPTATAYTTASEDNVGKTARHLLTPLNSLSNRIAFHEVAFGLLPATLKTLDRENDLTGHNPNLMPNPYRQTVADPTSWDTPVRTNVNTASFGELWRAYWDVMVANDGTANAVTGTNTTGLGAGEEPNGEHQFRSPLRYPATTARVGAVNMALLRSAVAAQNLVALRDPAGIRGRATATLVTSNDIAAGMQAVVGSTATDVAVRVYGQERQPFITEVFANTDNETLPGGDVARRNTNGYIAIELFNPYPAGAANDLDLSEYRLISVMRTGASVVFNPATDLNVRLGDIGVTTVPGGNAPGSRIVIDNMDGSPSGAKWTPRLAFTPVNVYHTSELRRALGRELMVIRPLSSGSVAAPTATLNGWAPVDAYDFTGLTVSATLESSGAGATKPAFAWHYVRQNDTNWRCVYPGRYNPAGTPRQEGTQTKTWQVTLNQTAESDTEPAAELNPALEGSAEVQDAEWQATGTYGPERATTNRPGVRLGYVDPQATYGVTYQIPLNMPNWPSPQPTSPAQFPFGLFARDGDLLQVPFIGSYRLSDPAASTVLEFTPITMDAAMADDDDDTTAGVANNLVEQLGRFCSINNAPSGAGRYTGADTYAWCGRIFSYMGVQDVVNDTSPDDGTGVPTPSARGITASTAGTHEEHAIPLQGKVNINTAPWQVLAALPMANDPVENRKLAKAIVLYRDGNGTAGSAHGPFHSIMDLNRVPAMAAADIGETSDSRAFVNATGADFESVDFDQHQGDLSPADVTAGTPDGVIGDFEQRFAAFTRISNLITTRSDSFVAYVLVQAWADAGTQTPVLLGERRRAFLIDRSAMSRQSPTPANLVQPIRAQERGDN